MYRAEFLHGKMRSSRLHKYSNMDTHVFHSARGCLSYLVVDSDTREAALIDPSTEISLETYLSACTEHKVRLRYVIETHTHADHISSAPLLRAATSAKLVRHERAPSELKDIAVVGGEQLPLGSQYLEIVATPGHTNESISIVADGMVFTGDALLIGGTGRTDFQLGDSEALYHSLHDRLATLPDDTVVYPAHDYKGRTSSTIGVEKNGNPRFLLSEEVFISTMNEHHPPVPELFEESIAANSV